MSRTTNSENHSNIDRKALESNIDVFSHLMIKSMVPEINHLKRFKTNSPYVCSTFSLCRRLF